MNKTLQSGIVTSVILVFSLPAQLYSQNGAGIVISQIYGGGGNQGATLRNDYVELFNRSNQAIDVTGWTVQYASATGSSWNRTQLSGVIQPGQYYLVQEAQGNAGSVSLPASDASGGINLSAIEGKIALVRSLVNLTGSSPSSPNIVDLVGYGGATYSLGAPAGTLNNTTAALRSGNGCVDTRNNSTDFSVGVPSPHNSQSSRNSCVATCTFSLSAYSSNSTAAGGAVSVDVTAGSDCSWTATTSASWIIIINGASGIGPGSATLSILANPSAQSRSGIVTVAGYSFTVTQSATTSGGLTGGLRFVSLTPCRVMETRTDYNFPFRTGSFGPPFMTAGETRTLNFPQSGACSIPAAANAYVINVTLIPRGSVDFVTVFPAGDSRPTYRTASSPDGQTVANSAIVKAGASGGISVYTSGPTDLLIDIAGYLTSDSAVSDLVFYPMAPCRVVETRAIYQDSLIAGTTFGRFQMNDGESRTYPIRSSQKCGQGIPGTVAAYAVTLTVVPPGPLAYVTSWPTGQSQPGVSSINSFLGRTLANSVILPAGAGGSIDVFAYNKTDLLMDLTGYFAPDNGAGLFYFPVTQCRAADSTLYSDQTVNTIAIPSAAGCSGIPADAKAYSLNVTALPNGNPMPFITAYPTGQPMPGASILNAFEGQTVTNSAITPSGTNGAVDIFAFKRTNVIAEVSGFFGR